MVPPFPPLQSSAPFLFSTTFPLVSHGPPPQTFTPPQELTFFFLPPRELSFSASVPAWSMVSIGSSPFPDPCKVYLAFFTIPASAAFCFADFLGSFSFGPTPPFLLYLLLRVLSLRQTRSAQYSVSSVLVFPLVPQVTFLLTFAVFPLTRCPPRAFLPQPLPLLVPVLEKFAPSFPGSCPANIDAFPCLSFSSSLVQSPLLLVP